MDGGSADKRYEEGKLGLANRRAEKPTERSDFFRVAANNGKKNSVCSHLERQLEIMGIDDGVLGDKTSARDWFPEYQVTGRRQTPRFGRTRERWG